MWNQVFFAVGFLNGNKRFVKISRDFCHFQSTFLQRPLISCSQEASESIFILKMRTLDPKSCGQPRVSQLICGRSGTQNLFPCLYVLRRHFNSQLTRSTLNDKLAFWTSVFLFLAEVEWGMWLCVGDKCSMFVWVKRMSQKSAGSAWLRNVRQSAFTFSCCDVQLEQLLLAALVFSQVNSNLLPVVHQSPEGLRMQISSKPLTIQFQTENVTELSYKCARSPWQLQNCLEEMSSKSCF